MAPPRLSGLTKLTLETAPSVCHECVWWQSRVARRDVDKDRWMERVEEEYGAFGTLYYGDDGRTLGVDPVRPGAALPARLGAARRPAVRGRDARHLRLPRRRPRRPGCCSRSSSRRSARRATATSSCIEAFAYRYDEGESAHARFREHRTVFPADFLGDFGFRVVRTSGRVGLARLELGGLAPVEEGRRAKVLRVVKEAFLPDPLPAPRP